MMLTTHNIIDFEDIASTFEHHPDGATMVEV